MLSAGTSTTWSRSAIALCGVMAALVFAPPAGAAGGGTDSDGSPAYGGSMYFDPPTIASLRCQSACGAAASVTRSGPVSVREKGVLRVRGRNLDVVRTVLFLGAPGRRDNLGVAPITKSTGWLDVKVPVGAQSGRIALLDPRGHSSPPSATRLRVLLDPNASSSQGFIWPVRGPLTGWFGENRGDHVHTGLDIAAPAGTPIKAAAAGTVVLLAREGGYGNFTCLRHSRYVTCYAHQSQYLTTYGATVHQGQVIGRVGCTGNCSGPHLHFEVRQGPGPWSTPMDPLQYLPRR